MQLFPDFSIENAGRTENYPWISMVFYWEVAICFAIRGTFTVIAGVLVDRGLRPHIILGFAAVLPNCNINAESWGDRSIQNAEIMENCPCKMMILHWKLGIVFCNSRSAAASRSSSSRRRDVRCTWTWLLGPCAASCSPAAGPHATATTMWFPGIVFERFFGCGPQTEPSLEWCGPSTTVLETMNFFS